MKKKGDNLLECIPKKNEEFTWKTDDDNNVVVTVIRKGFYNRIAQKFFKVPKSSEIKLDLYGSFVWQFIDGKNNIQQIADAVKSRFDKEAEPLYNRLIAFIKILKANKFIILERKDK